MTDPTFRQIHDALTAEERTLPMSSLTWWECSDMAVEAVVIASADLRNPRRILLLSNAEDAREMPARSAIKIERVVWGPSK